MLRKCGLCLWLSMISRLTLPTAFAHLFLSMSEAKPTFSLSGVHSGSQAQLFLILHKSHEDNRDISLGYFLFFNRQSLRMRFPG
jgi:hypothetical protein